MLALIFTALAFFLSRPPLLHAQTFNCGSTGANGALDVTTPGTYDFYPGNPVQFSSLSDPEGDNIFHFTTINIASGVTLRMSGRFLNGPVFLLASSDVRIDGTIDLKGEDGGPNTSIPANRTVAMPGAGGYAGGIGGKANFPAQSGGGPAGGVSGTGIFHGNAGGGGFTGNAFLIPLIGGSGGGGGYFPNPPDPFGAGGGAGGGAVLICSSSSLTVNGSITAAGGNGGQGANPGVTLGFGGGGAAGAIRLVTPVLKGTGSLAASVIRFEAFQQNFTGTPQPPAAVLASPFALFLPSTSTPAVRVTSIDGKSVPANPTGSFTLPDVGISKSTPVTVNIAAKNVPIGTVVKLYISSENATDQTVDSTPLTGSLSASTATATVTFPSGFSLGYVRATWTNQ